MMKGFNSVQMIGNIGQDIELRHTNSGTGVTTLRLAVSERAKVNGEWGDVTNWFDIVCWGKTAELCVQYLKKGSSVFVVGRLAVRSYEDKQGQKRIKTEVIAEDVKFLGGGQAQGSPYDNDKLYDDNTSGSEFSYE
jgi:single-strand DNA-binding protein